MEELELAEQMDALGLPLSFGTSKVRNVLKSKGKSNGRRVKYHGKGQEVNDQVPPTNGFSQTEGQFSSRVFQDDRDFFFSSNHMQVDAGYCDAHSSDMHYDSTCLTALDYRNESGDKPIYEFRDTNTGNHVTFESPPDTSSFQFADAWNSVCLHGGNNADDVLKNASSALQVHYDEGLSIEQDDEVFVDDSSILFCNMHLEDDNGNNETVQACFEFGDWSIHWDPFYKRNYFFNVQSQESTWVPPSDLKKPKFSCSNAITKEKNACAAKEHEGTELTFDSINEVMDSIFEDGLSESPVAMSAKIGVKIDFATHGIAVRNGDSITQLPFHSYDETTSGKELQKNAVLLMPVNSQANEEDDIKYVDEHEEKQCSMSALNEDKVACISTQTWLGSSELKVQGLDQHLSSHLAKYWCQRYLLFSRYDKGIKMDEEGWFSVTPEVIAKHHAFRCGGGTIVDCFTGVGGNAIQFAMRSNHVIAIDVDPQKICYAQHNAVIYGVSEKIDFIKGDFFKIAPWLKGDVVFLSPPWGGPNYAKAKTYDLRSLKPHEGRYLFKIARMIASKVVMFLPRSVNINQLMELSMSVDPPWSLEVEKNYLNGKLKSITAYFCNTTAE